MSIPELAKTKTNEEIGQQLGVTGRQVSTWIKKLRARGIEVITKKGPRPILK